MSDDAADFPLELSERKQLLLEMLLQEEGLAASVAHDIPPRKPGDVIPLSYTQEPLWILDQANPGSTAYNVIFPLEFRGPMNVGALEQAIDQVVQRHEALRTTLVALDGRPFQNVVSTLTLRPSSVDFSSLPVRQQEAAVSQWISREAALPFDLARGPLFRTGLLRLGHERHLLILSLHHIICDTWSVGLLNREIRLYYRAFLEGQPLTLPKLSIQFGDFAIWQRQQLQGELLEHHLAYWKQQLVDLPVVQLPTGKVRPEVRTFPAARQSFVIGETLTQELKELSRREGATLFMTLLAAFKVLLARYSGQSDIVVGSPNANRNLAQIEGVVGFFINPLVMRTDLSANPAFTDVLARVRQQALEAYAHQDVPFQRLLQELGPKGGDHRTNHSTLFQVFFSLQNIRFPELELSKLSSLPTSWVTDPHPTAKFDLYLNMIESAGELIGTLEYDAELFEPVAITRMSGHFETLLTGIAANPRQRIAFLPILSEVERNQLLVAWIDTAVDCPSELCFHRLFEAQAEQSPDSIAVVADQGHLSYRELNRRANHIARQLQAFGTGPETVVGLCIQPSAEMTAGVLGTLKAGAVCLPLDPTLPKERLAFMVKDSGMSVLLTCGSLFDALAVPGIRLIDMDTEARGVQSDENVRTEASSDNAAFVFYTSGTTGQPSGVVISHGSGCHGQFPKTATHRLFPEDSLLMTTSVGSARLMGELFWPWLAGAKVVVAAPGTHQDSGHLVKAIAEHRVTVMSCVPSMLRLFLEEEQLIACSSLRMVFSVGEELSADLQERFHTRVPADLYNSYAQTEACPLTFWKSECRSHRGLAPIGRPAANTHVYLLDSHLQPVPLGSSGEIHIGGHSLARGYLNDAGLTARKFIPHPFSSRPGNRLYRNGDVARYLPDGNLEFVGRVDHQVKIRGNRIELEEIEAVLTEHAVVRDAVVIARQDSPGHLRLVAYVISDRDAFSAAELRRVLKERLPEYMVPSLFVRLETFPLTATGKIDRRALPAPEHGRPLENAVIAPRNPLEKTLTDVWSEVLGVTPIGIHDDFFELGGHSLLAIQLLHRLRQVLDIEVPLREFLPATSVAKLAGVIEEILLNELENVSEEDAQRSLEKASRSAAI